MKKRADRKWRPHGGNSRSLVNRKLTQKSELARHRALHVLAAMRRDPNLSLSQAAKLEGVKPETIKRHFSSSLRKIAGKFRIRKSDRYAATLYLPDAHGNPVPLTTRSSKERRQASNYLRDLGRYLRGQKNALDKWQGKKIAGVELVTTGRTVVALEAALSDFHIYRALNGDAA
jgi:hypothetical protein